MNRVLTGVLVSLTIPCAFVSAANAATVPSFSASFSPSTVSIGDTTQLTFTLSGGDGPFSPVYVDAELPEGLQVVASSSSQCGGTLKTTALDESAPPDGRRPAEISLDGASLAAGGTCSFSVPVTADSAGPLTVSAGVTVNRDTSDGHGWGYGYGTTAVLTVPAIAAPATVTSAFTPDTVVNDGTTTWTVRIANPNASTTLTHVRFLANMPIAIAGIAPYAITGDDCQGTGIVQRYLSTATITGPYVRYDGGSIAPGAQCAITVSMSVDWSPFDHVTLPVAVMSNEGGASAVSTAALHELKPPSNRFTYSKPKVARDGTITETVSVPANGSVRLGETWQGKLVAQARRTVTTGGKLTVKLVPRAATRRTLKSHRAARLKLSIAYTPAGGQTRTVRLTAHTPR